MTATGLTSDDVETMFQAVRLKQTIDEAHGQLPGNASGGTAAQRRAVTRAAASAAVAGIPESDRLGLGTGSLTAYVKEPKKWGENRAAWQRRAVERMPGAVARRINDVATSAAGTALAGPVVRRRVEAELVRTPAPTEEQLVTRVAGQNNPGEARYGGNVWKTYQRLYPAIAPEP